MVQSASPNTIHFRFALVDTERAERRPQHGCDLCAVWG